MEEPDGWGVLFNKKSRESFAINPVGVLLFKSLDGLITVEELVCLIKAEFEHTPITVYDDVVEIIIDLEHKGFIE